jgi:hypothetical protein
MPVSERQMAALKALLSVRPKEHERLVDEMEEVEGPDSGGRYAALIGAALFEAVEKRFVRKGKVAPKREIIGYVAEVRSRNENAADDLDPRVAERILMAVLDQGEIDDLDDETVLMHEILLTAVMVIDQQYSEEELDAFLALVRRTADEWLES